MRSRPDLGRLALAVCVLPILLGCSSLTRPIFGLSQEDEDRMNAHLTNAIWYYDRGRYAQAEQQFQKVLEVDDGNMDASVGLAMSQLYQGTPAKLAAAGEQMELARSLDPDDFRVYFGLGCVGYREALFAQSKLDAWKTNPPIAEPGRNPIAEATAARDRALEAASIAYKKALELNKDYVYALSGLGQVAALRGDRDLALSFFQTYLDRAAESRRFYEERKLRAQNPNDLDSATRKLASNERKEADVRKLVATLLYKKADYRGAIQNLDRVLEVEPTAAREYLNRAQCYAALGSFAQATADVEAFLKKYASPSDSTLQEAHRLLIEYRSKAALAAVAPAPGS